MTTTRSYHYHAGAHALSGHLTRPLEHVIEVQAGTTLPTTGGHGSSRIEDFRFNEMVSFDAAYSQVSGSEKKVENGNTIHTTLATSVVEGLNILDVVTADRVVARLSSSYDLGDESRILVLGSRFENLRIAGFKIEVVLHHELILELNSFEKVIVEFGKNGEFWKMAHAPVAPGESPKKLPAKVEKHGVVRCSMVKELQPEKCPGIVRHGHYGHVLVVPDFGKIHLAEILFEYGRKTLTMLRIELGSPNGGALTVTEATSNGRPPGGP